MKSRRQVLRELSLGLGAVTLPGCGFPRNLAEMCGADPQRRDVADSLAPRGAQARWLLGSVDTIVVVMMENRSFDHLLGSLRTDPAYPARGVIDGLTGEESNPDGSGRPVRVTRMPGRGDGSAILKHDAANCRLAWNSGGNDGFVRINQPYVAPPLVGEVMSYLDRDQIPFQYALADNFTVCDRWFSSFMGPTWPNRFFLHATTSGGRQTNLPLGLDAPPTIWERTALTCHSVKHYAAGPLLWYAAAFPGKALSGNSPFVPERIEDFFGDARAGGLPNLSIIDPDFKVSDGYPTHDIHLSEGFLSAIYRALAASPQWSRTLLVVTYDEHGGYFDHVAPPLTGDPRPGFAQLGFRVPAFAIGPTVWKGRVVSTTFEHSSIAATLAARFGIASLGARMSASADLSSCIDPRLVGRPTPAPVLPTVELDRGSIAAVAGSTTSQAEIERNLDDKSVPAAWVDSRAQDVRLASWLRWAQELEAVRLVG